MSARRGAIPTASAIRLSLARRVTINTMTAGERVFVDLLPDSWSGPPPALPPEVIRELAERARAAERALRVQRAVDGGEEAPADPRPRLGAADLRPFRLRDARRRRRLLGAERAEAHAVRSTPCSISTWPTPRSPRRRTSPRSTRRSMAIQSAVEISLIGDVDVHSFREDKNYMSTSRFQQPTSRPRNCLSRTPRMLRRQRPPRPAAGMAAARNAAPQSNPRRRGRSEASRAADRRNWLAEASAKHRDQAGDARQKPPTARRDGKAGGNRPAKRRLCGDEGGRPPCRRQRQRCRLQWPPMPAAASPVAPQPPAASRRRQYGFGQRQPRQRRPASDLRLRRRHAGGDVSPRRYGLAGVRYHQAARYRADPQPMAARSSPKSACCRWTRGRRSASGSTARKCRR